MKGLCFPTGALIGAELLDTVHGFGCEGARLKADHGIGALETAALADEVLQAGMQPYVTIAQAEQIDALDSRILIGLFNEPDLNDISIARYVAEADDCLTRGLRVWLGEVSNLNDRGFTYLSRLPWDRWPVDQVGCSFHRYPERSGPTTPHKGSKSRADEVAKLRRIVGNRSLICGEVGYNCLDFSEAEQADYMAWEARFWVEQGIDWVLAYQINDGPAKRHDDHYGFRRLDGTWKPVTRTFFERG